jgi:uncharacterized membrane protein
MSRYAQVLSGGGIAILYLSLFAAYQFYQLISQPVTFAFMAVVTAASVVLAIRHDSIIIGILATLGGFLTPVLLSTGVDKQIGLFTYITFLDVAIIVMALYKNWQSLNYLSFALTELMLLAWGQQFYTDAKLARTEFFLTEFFLIFSVLAYLNYRRGAPRVKHAILLSVLNVLGYFLGSSFILFPHTNAFFIFLALFSLALITVSMIIEKSEIKLEAFLLVAAAQLFWLRDRYAPGTRGLLDRVVIEFTALFLVYFLAGAREFIKYPLQGDLFIAFVNAAVYFGSMYYVLDPKHRDALGPLAVAMAGIYFALVYRLRDGLRAAQLNPLLLLGIALTFVTIAAPIQLHQQWITLAWAVEAVLLTWAGFRADNVRVRQAAAVVFLLVLLRLWLYEAEPLFDTSRGYPIFFNKRFAIFLMSLVCFYLAVAIFSAHRPQWQTIEKGMLDIYFLTACVLTVGIITMEIVTYFDQRISLVEQLATWGQESDRARRLLNAARLSISLFWASYSILGVIVSIVWRYRPLRLLSIALFGLTIFKVFLFDTLMLEKIYRVASLISLGALLLVASYLFQKYRAQISAIVMKDE